MAIQPPDEQALVTSLRQREPGAFEKVYDCYGLLVYRLVLRIVKDPATSEDIVQDTFARVWNGACHLNESAKHIGPWIFTIARNRALDHVRSCTSHSQRQDSILESFNHYITLSSVEESMITEEHVHRLSTALHGLSAEQHEVIQLAYYGGLSQSQIAEQMNRPLGTVKSWTRSALTSLRSALELSEN